MCAKSCDSSTAKLIFKEFLKYLKTAYFEITKAAASLDLSGTDKYT